VSDPAPLGAGPALIRAGSVLNTIYERHARELGLTAQQARLLFVVSEAPSNMLGLGAMAQLGKSTMTSLVDRMEQLGLLTRSADPDDRRRLVVSATQHGVELSRQFEASMRDSVTGLMSSLGDADRRTLAQLLSVVLVEGDRLLRSE
jgi:DNA-binding MarR family transcriptional regulator